MPVYEGCEACYLLVLSHWDAELGLKHWESSQLQTDLTSTTQEMPV